MSRSYLPLILNACLSLSLPLVLIAPALAVEKTAESTGPSLVEDDRKFLQAANQGGLFEVKTSEMAITRKVLVGTDLDFAKRMVNDHTKVNAELSALAAKKGVMLPDHLDEDHQKKSDALAKREDSKLAKEYLDAQVKAHKTAVSAFEDAAEDSKDTDVKAFAAKHLPHLQAHLDEAKRLQDLK